MNEITNGYLGPIAAIARSVLALSTLLTIVLNSPGILFGPVSGNDAIYDCDGFSKFNIFCVGGSPGSLNIGYLISVFILLFCVIGILPGLMSIAHFWVCFSFQIFTTLPDGGDQLAVFLSFMFMVFHAGDTRWTHWNKSVCVGYPRQTLQITGIFLIKTQMSIVYLNSAIHKMAMADWREGSVMYYLVGGYFAPSGLFETPYHLVVNSPWGTLSIAWLSMAIEFLLGICLLTPEKFRIALLVIGFIFHFLIFVLLGITSFQLVMVAGLLILTIPTNSGLFNGNRTIMSLIKSWKRDKDRSMFIG